MLGIPPVAGTNPATSDKPLDYVLGAAKPPAPVTHREFTDYDTTRKSIFDNVLKTTQERYPLENQRHKLELQNLKYEDLNHFSLMEQKKAIMEGHTLQKKLTGDWVLTDKASGKEMDRKSSTVAHVPWMTPRGTFIFNGNEYTVANQMRLKPGVFTRVKENGVIEAHVNVKPGTGPSFRVYMEPETGIFRLAVGQSNLKLYPILRSMGMSEKDISKTWGPELLQKNIAAEDPRAVSRAYLRLINTRSDETARTEGEAMDKEAALFGDDPEFDKSYSEGSALTKDLFEPPAETWANVRIGKSPIEGKGLFARTHFDTGDIIAPAFVFTGMEGHHEDVKRSVPARWINHSEEPTIELKVDGDIVWMTALRPLDEGEELVADYLESHETVGRWMASLQQQEKVAKIGAKDADRRWTKLWYTGRLIAARHNQKDWVLLKVHKGLCEATYDSLKAEGVDCEPKFDQPHISVLRPEDIEELKEKHHNSWQGAAKIGMPMRFRVVRITNLVPAGWPQYDRVWFLECESPDLEKYRQDLGLAPLPKNHKSGHDMRFHITVAVHPNAVSKAAELLLEKRAMSITEPKSSTSEVNTQADPYGKALLGQFQKMEIDPEVTSATLGHAFSNTDVPTMMRITQKLINVSKATEDTDDRDSLAFQTLHGPEDFFAERIKRDAGMTARKLLWRASARGSVKHIPSGALTPQLHSVLLSSGMGAPIEETNPLDIFDQNQRILRLGEGAIPTIEAVPDEARSVQPSHFGFIDPIRGPESEKIGVDLRVSHGAVKGSDGQFYTKMNNMQTGEKEFVSASHAAKSVIAFPGEMKRKTPMVRAMVNARSVEYVPRKEVQYELPHASNMFSAGSNLVPLISGIKGGRLLMGAKYAIQALPLKDAETPFVRGATEDGKSFEEHYSSFAGAIRATDHGIIQNVTPDNVVVRYKNGQTKTHELYNNFPFNRKTLINSTPVVKIGDKVQPGQLIVHSNYTDKEGNIALGKNLRVAYMPYRGLNFEDAIVISEGAAKKLSSEHMYQLSHDVDEHTQVGRKGHISMFPTAYKREQLTNIGSDGVVKPGSVVKHGDPLVLSMQKTKIDALHRGHRPMWSDNSTTWHHTSDGVVTDVSPTKEGGYNVIVKSYSPMQEGDKMCGRYGDKGVVAHIVPDHKMIHDKDGKPFEILLNPLGLITRVNPSQAIEAALGKVADHTGKPYVLPSFMEDNLIGLAQKELSRHNLSDTEDVFDPASGRKITKVFTGNRFMMKLHHTAESKGRGRDIGGYTSEGLPARGGEGGSKRVGQMEQAALISHGATEVLKDAQIVRGQRNDDWWSSFRRGLPPPSPKIPFIYNKFLGYMQGAGINVKKNGDRMNLMAMTDKDVEKLSSGQIGSRATVRGDTMQEIDGGLFDRRITGGHNGDKWGHIQLIEPMPNPVFEEPIRTLLGLTSAKFEDVIAGREKLGGKTGVKAIHESLKNIKTADAIRYYEGVITDGRKTARDKAIKSLGYLKGIAKGGLQPEDLMMSKVPVLPPNMRPITVFRKMTMVADPNYLYRDLMLANETLGAVKKDIGDHHAGDERLAVYNSFKAVTGLGDPVQSKTKDKGVRGLLSHVFGAGSPKFGMFQRRVLSSSVDEVGRATITINPELNMDQVGLPEPKAWVIYRPFVMRRLVRRGMPALQAAKEVANQSKMAKDAMLEEIEERPVIINRAPVLHRYGFMAAWPKLVKGETLHVPPSVVKGFNADFDGDAMNYHVPATDSAVKDAVEKMMPSRNLRAVRNFGVQYTPQNEFLMGLYLASKADNKNEHKVFANKKAVLDAWKRGELDVGDRIVTKD